VVLAPAVEDCLISMECVERVCHAPLVTSVLDAPSTPSPALRRTWTAGFDGELKLPS
jgi:hypothetical protein